jgi:suppressor of ftsI
MRVLNKSVVITAILLLAALVGRNPLAAQNNTVELPAPPEVRSPFVLSAVNDPVTGKTSFSFDGREIPPVIRTAPGEQIRLKYLNRMSTSSQEFCVDGRCTNMTNLHFHGLHVSPDSPQDDVITMMAMPGESLHYVVDIPKDQPPGLYWYHTHPHGESYQQSLDGMSGAIIVEGIESYVPEIRQMQEKVLILRDRELRSDDSVALKAAVSLSPSKCGAASGEPGRVFTVNGVVRPRIPIASGQNQFWRIVNASPDLYADIMVDHEDLTVVAIDGMPLAYHDPKRKTEKFQHILLAPAGRVEAIVTGLPAGAQSSLRTLCVDTGADGDPNPAMVIADLDETATRKISPSSTSVHPLSSTQAVYKPLPHHLIASVEKSVPQYVVNFTEDQHGFYINGKKYGPADGPMTTVKVGSYVHWRVNNNTRESHPFHIHQVHFLVYQSDGKLRAQAEWMDTVNVEPQQSVDLVMDFTDPIIRGMSLFHCHLLKHEDKGMMAKILFK